MRITESATDSDLVAALPHDIGAFEVFYARHVVRVMAFAARRCATAEDVADVVAVTFVRLLDVADRYDPSRGEPVAFLFGIAANAVRDLHRQHARHRALVEKLAGRDLLDADDIEQIEAAIDAARAMGSVHEALDAVPPGEQEVLRLVAEGRTPGQAAAELGISSSAARKRLFRARQRVRSQLNEHEQGVDR